MAVSTSTGLISGLNTSSIISALMAVEKLPLDRLKTQQTTVDSKISALGKIKSAIASFQEAAEAISTTNDFFSYKATLANEDIATATATDAAVAGTYSVEVEQLATRHKLRSSATADPSAGGTLTIELGSTSTGSFVRKSGTSAVNVTINAGSTLEDVADAINGADAGVSAAIINGSSGAQLVLTSKDTGEINQIKIGSTISGLGFDPDAPLTVGNLTQVDEAKNAIVKIDGITIANTTSNTVTDAITGLTLTLKGTNDNVPTELTVSNDTSAIETKVKAFVDAYNTARKTMKDLTQYDPDGENTGVLNGDGTVSSALSQLRGLLSTVPAGASSAYQYLSDLGIETSSDGTMTLDTDVLKAALTADFSASTQSIAAYAEAFSDLATEMNQTDGLIADRLASLNTTSDGLDDRIRTQEELLTRVQARYQAQFTALETLLASLQTTESYLSQQLASLNN